LLNPPGARTLAHMADDDTTPHVDPPRETRHCAICGATAYYGFGPPGVLPAD
jgi:hypothetical protein